MSANHAVVPGAHQTHFWQARPGVVDISNRTEAMPLAHGGLDDGQTDDPGWDGHGQGMLSIHQWQPLPVPYPLYS